MLCQHDALPSCQRAHREARDQRAFDQLVRIVTDDLAVLARTGFGFVGVDDEEARAVGARLLRHERPFEPRGEARAAAAAQRSEEHTSALQSLTRISYAVFCLKKKTYTITTNTHDTSPHRPP